jgi:hypothetical protein
VSVRLAHLINPLAESAQVLESMRRARRAAGMPVELVAADFPGAPVPEGFVAAAPLSRSVIDCGSFAEPRRLPLAGDLLARLIETGADWQIFTNADIVVAPEFYARAIAWSGELDAFTINRRTVPAPLELDRLPEGLPHPGHDCFVFRAGLLDGVDFGSLCVGFPPVGAVLAAVLSMAAPRFRILADERLTFHEGDQRDWRDDRFADYWEHNRREGAQVIERAAKRFGLSRLAEEVSAEVLTIERLEGF